MCRLCGWYKPGRLKEWKDHNGYRVTVVALGSAGLRGSLSSLSLLPDFALTEARTSRGSFPDSLCASEKC